MRRIRLIGPIGMILFLALSASADTITLSAPVARAAGGEPWLVVAASDTPQTLKDRADYVCDGTADEKEINAAFSVASAVKLCPGTFVVSNSINMASNTMLSGSGPGTIIKLKDAATGVIKIITNVLGASNIFITNLRLDGNNKAGEGYGIYFGKVSADPTIECKIENIQAENFSKDGIYLQAVKNSFINNNVCKNNDGAGIRLWSLSDNNIVTSNLVENNQEGGLRLGGGSCNVISNNICSSQRAGSGIDLASNQVTYYIVSDNICKNNPVDGIGLTMAKYNNIISNICYENQTNGIAIQCFYGKGADNNAIVANSCIGNSKYANGLFNDIYIAGSSYNNVQGNTCRAGTGSKKPKYGILVEKYVGIEAQKNLVTNNDCYNDGFTTGAIDYTNAPTTITAPGNRQ